MNLSASSSPSKKIWMNLVSALNLVPIISAGRLLAISLPSIPVGILLRSRKAEFLSPAGGILVDGGRRLERVLWVLPQEKTSKAP